MVLETTSKVADAALPIGSNVGHLANVVVHVTRGEEEDRDESDGGPDITALEDRDYVRPGDERGSQTARDDDECRDPSNPVDGALDGRMGTVREVAGDPAVDELSSLGSGKE